LFRLQTNNSLEYRVKIKHEHSWYTCTCLPVLDIFLCHLDLRGYVLGGDGIMRDEFDDG